MTDNKRLYWLGGDTASEQDTFFLEALDDRLWAAGTADNWDACWHTSMPDPELFEQLTADKTINHIPGNSALTIKSNLHRTLSQAKQRVEGLPQAQRYDFYPQTYSMPEDYFAFQTVAKNESDSMWIQKPKNLSRGRGIEVVNHPETVPLSNDWIIQRYLSSPHLWDGYKYVLRCYVLVTSVEPLRFYWYHEGFAKLTSEPYSNEDLDNPYRHLTNPDINEDNADVDVPVTFYSFKHYREWLQSEGINDDKLFAELEDLIGLTVIAAREKMRTQSQTISADMSGAYELIGLDCMVDSDFKPWILECNLSPSLATYSGDESGGDEETAIKRNLVADLVNIIGLNETQAEHHLNAQQKATAEQQRAGGFKCIFPSEQANNYLHCFPVPRYPDIASLPDTTTVDYSKLPLQGKTGVEAVFPDSLALLSQGNEQYHQQQAAHYIYPNELATWIWLQNAAGLRPEQIAQELAATVNASLDEQQQIQQQYQQQVWEVLADWSQANLLTQASSTNDETVNRDIAKQTAANKQPHTDNTQWNTTRYLNLAGTQTTIRCACAIAAEYLEPFTSAEPLINSSKNISSPNITLDILRSNYGYVVIHGSHVAAGSKRLSQLIPECLQIIERHCLQPHELTVIAGAVLSIQGHNILFTREPVEQLDNLAYAILEQTPDSQLVSGSCIITTAPAATQATSNIRRTDLPLFLPAKLADKSQAKPQGTLQQKMTKTPWLIAEQAENSLWLAATKPVHYDESQATEPELFNIDAIVTLKVSDELADDNSKTSHQEVDLQTLSGAETIAVLWEQCVTALARTDATKRLYQDTHSVDEQQANRQQAVAQALPAWLANVQGLQLTIAPNQDISKVSTQLLPQLIKLLKIM